MTNITNPQSATIAIMSAAVKVTQMGDLENLKKVKDEIAELNKYIGKRYKGMFSDPNKFSQPKHGRKSIVEMVKEIIAATTINKPRIPDNDDYEILCVASDINIYYEILLEAHEYGIKYFVDFYTPEYNMANIDYIWLDFDYCNSPCSMKQIIKHASEKAKKYIADNSLEGYKAILNVNPRPTSDSIICELDVAV